MSKLKLEDLKVGMKVAVSDLSSIVDTYILLKNTEVEDGEVTGIIDSILYSQSKTAQEKISLGEVCCVYNDIYYEE